MRVHLVPQKARGCAWPGGSGILFRRRNPSHHGRQADPGGGLWVGNAHLCLSDIGVDHFRQSGGALPNRPN